MKTIFTNDPPNFTKQEAAEQIQIVFHKKGELQELYSDRDQNFLFTTKNQKYLLKIYNSLESYDEPYIDFYINSLEMNEKEGNFKASIETFFRENFIVKIF